MQDTMSPSMQVITRALPACSPSSEPVQDLEAAEWDDAFRWPER